MRILGIETSCDETAVAVVDDGHLVRSSVIASQIAKHAPYGGVIPELAAREHLEAIELVVGQALADAGVGLHSIDGIAVTHSPGLAPALLVGINYAKGVAATLGVPFVGVNHFLAHVFGAFIDHPGRLADPAAYPILSLVVSGGHTALLVVEADGTCRLVGQTLDDAAGEAFDKAAKLLDLGYPGGPLVDRLAKLGNPAAYTFPRGLTAGSGSPLLPENRLNFSFSGLKTSLLHHLGRRTGQPIGRGEAYILPTADLHDTLASFQEAIVDVLTLKTRWGVDDVGARTVVLCGGVACNSRLRAVMQDAFRSGPPLFIAPPKYCTDNAAMIGGLGYYYLRRGEFSTYDLDAVPRLGTVRSVPFTQHGLPAATATVDAVAR